MPPATSIGAGRVLELVPEPETEPPALAPAGSLSLCPGRKPTGPGTRSRRISPHPRLRYPVHTSRTAICATRRISPLGSHTHSVCVRLGERRQGIRPGRRLQKYEHAVGWTWGARAGGSLSVICATTTAGNATAPDDHFGRIVASSMCTHTKSLAQNRFTMGS